MRGQRYRGSRRDRLTAALVLVALAGFVAAVYLVVVRGGGLLVGATSGPQVALSILATAVVALSFETVQARLEHLAGRLVHGGRPSAYEVLSRFTGTVTGAYPNEEVPARMAMLLAEATGAAWAEVWLVVRGRLTMAATWPPPDAGSDPAGRPPGGPEHRSLPVLQAGELLGELRVGLNARVPLSPVEEQLFAGLVGQAGLVLRGVRLRVELEQRLAELSGRVEELRISTERLVDIQDGERRRLERDIHDGAQQHLVALAVTLRLVAKVAERAPARAERLLAAQSAAARATIETLVGLSRGIYPVLLGQAGVAAAISAATGSSPVPVDVTDRAATRYPPAVEAAVYFCCLEALQNAVKHSGAGRVTVDLSVDGDALVAVVEDDGEGFDHAATAAGAGMMNMRDRIDAVGGRLDIETPPRGGTQVRARVPAAARAGQA